MMKAAFFRCRVGADSLQQAQAIHLRHVEIRNDQVMGLLRHDLGPCSPSPAAVICLNPSCVQRITQQQSRGDLIVHDEDFYFFGQRHYSLPSLRAAVNFKISSPIAVRRQLNLDGPDFLGDAGIP